MRECGTCVVCCVYPRMTEPGYEKDGLTPCKFLKPMTAQFEGSDPCGNCTVYEDRPKGCSDYTCQWLAGHGETEDRPDLTGIVFDTLPPAGKKFSIENAVIARPIRVGAQNTDDGMALIKRMSRSFDKPVIVLNFRERSIEQIVGRGA